MPPQSTATFTNDPCRTPALGGGTSERPPVGWASYLPDHLVDLAGHLPDHCASPQAEKRDCRGTPDHLAHLAARAPLAQLSVLSGPGGHDSHVFKFWGLAQLSPPRGPASGRPIPAEPPGWGAAPPQASSHQSAKGGSPTSESGGVWGGISPNRSRATPGLILGDLSIIFYTFILCQPTPKTQSACERALE